MLCYALKCKGHVLIIPAMVAIWPFLKRFARNKMICPFGHFLPFSNVEENGIF